MRLIIIASLLLLASCGKDSDNQEVKDSYFTDTVLRNQTLKCDYNDDYVLVCKGVQLTCKVIDAWTMECVL